MEPQTTDAEPRVLDTYGLAYAFMTVLLVPGLLVIDRWSIATFTPAYLALIAGPFLLGPAIAFLTDSKDGLRRTALRSVVLVPLVGLTGIMFIFVAMIIVLPPWSFFMTPENFAVLSVISAAVAVLLAAPLVISLVRRAREGLNAVGLLQMGVLLAGIATVGWMIAMTFDTGDTLGTFMRRDLVDYYVGAFTWYLPALALAAGLWRRTGIV